MFSDTADARNLHFLISLFIDVGWVILVDKDGDVGESLNFP